MHELAIDADVFATSYRDSLNQRFQPDPERAGRAASERALSLYLSTLTDMRDLGGSGSVAAGPPKRVVTFEKRRVFFPQPLHPIRGKRKQPKDRPPYFGPPPRPR